MGDKTATQPLETNNGQVNVNYNININFNINVNGNQYFNNQLQQPTAPSITRANPANAQFNDLLNQFNFNVNGDKLSSLFDDDDDDDENDNNKANNKRTRS